MKSSTHQQTIADALKKQLAISQTLLTCIQKEQSLLADRDIDLLESVTQQKLDFSEQLELEELKRCSSLRALGYAEDNEGIQKYFQSLTDIQRKRLENFWSKIMANLTICKDTNLANGIVLETSRNNAEQALAILRGQFMRDETYSQKGLTSAELGNRNLGKA